MGAALHGGPDQSCIELLILAGGEDVRRQKTQNQPPVEDGPDPRFSRPSALDIRWPGT